LAEQYVAFIDKKTKKAFEELKEGEFQDKKLYDNINTAIDHLKADHGYGIRIPHNLIPKDYVKKHEIDNLRKVNLPDGWRLLYTVQADKVMIVSVILEWMDHKNYERRFGYKG